MYENSDSYRDGVGLERYGVNPTVAVSLGSGTTLRAGYEHFRRHRWQAQLHLFSHPFYYVEYGIAQLGALQLWMKSREDLRRAVGNYRAALRLGGTRTLPELFAAAGIQFDFTEKTIRPLMNAIQEELEAQPA